MHPGALATGSLVLAFPGDSDGKESTCNAGDLGSIPGLGRPPGGEHGNHSSNLAWRIPMDRERSLVSYGPWGGKELEMTE